MQAKANFNDLLIKVVDVITVIFMAALFVVITFQVLNRFMLHIPAAWTEEMGRYCFVWLSMFGTVRALQSRVHLKIDIVESNLKGNSKLIVNILAEIIILVFCLILTVTGYTYTMSNIGNYCEFGKFPIYLIYMVMPIAGLLLCLISTETLLTKIKELFGYNKIQIDAEYRQGK